MNEIVKKQEAFLALGLKKEAQTTTFEEFTRNIRQRNTLVTLQRFWNAIPFSLEPEIKMREILSSYVLAFFPDISLSSERNEVEEQVHQTAIRLTNLLENITLDIEQLQQVAITYQKHFQTWKEADQADLLQLLDYIIQNLNTILEELDYQI